MRWLLLGVCQQIIPIAAGVPPWARFLVAPHGSFCPILRCSLYCCHFFRFLVVRRTPVHTIAMNAGAEGAVVVGELLKSSKPEWGHNAATGEYCDMIAAGIIDPTKVKRARLIFCEIKATPPTSRCACSAMASTLLQKTLTLECTLLFSCRLFCGSVYGIVSVV